MWHSSSTKAPFPRDRTVRRKKAGSPASPSILSHRSAFHLDQAGKKLLLTPLQLLSVSWKHAHAHVKCKPSAWALQSAAHRVKSSLAFAHPTPVVHHRVSIICSQFTHPTYTPNLHSTQHVKIAPNASNGCQEEIKTKRIQARSRRWHT